MNSRPILDRQTLRLRRPSQRRFLPFNFVACPDDRETFRRGSGAAARCLALDRIGRQIMAAVGAERRQNGRRCWMLLRQNDTARDNSGWVRHTHRLLIPLLPIPRGREAPGAKDGPPLSQ